MSCSGKNYREYVKKELVAACRKIIDNADGVVANMNLMRDFSVNIDIQSNEATEITIQSSHFARDYSEAEDGSYKFEVEYKAEGEPLKEKAPHVPEQNVHGITKADWGDI